MKKNYTVTAKKTKYNLKGDLTAEGVHTQLSGFPNEYTVEETPEKAIEAEKLNLKHIKKSEGFKAIITEKDVTVFDGDKKIEVYTDFRAEETNPDDKFTVINGKITLKEKNHIIDTIRERHPEIAEINTITVTLNGENYDCEYEYTTLNFERIRRIIGYLVGTLDRFNNAKRAEVQDRVKHGLTPETNAILEKIQ